MNILVCISIVPDTTSKININKDTSLFDPTGVQFIINPSDESALTRAIQLKEALNASVTIINVGTQKDEPVIRKAFSIGANSMIRVNSTPLDSYSVAKNIYDAVKDSKYDLILCGKESLDYHSNATPGMLATLLNYNFIDDVTSLNTANNAFVVEREIEGGKQKLEAQLPLLLAVQKELINEAELKIPNMRSIMQARTAKLEVIEPQNVAPKVSYSNMENPPKKGEIKMIDKDNLQELVKFLVDNK